jgi:hypothetical protein
VVADDAIVLAGQVDADRRRPVPRIVLSTTAA